MLQIYHHLSFIKHTQLSQLKWSYPISSTHVTYEHSKMGWLTKRLSVGEWLEHPAGFWEVMGLNPIGHSDFFSLS